MTSTPSTPSPRIRMSGAQRREQLIAIGRAQFAKHGVDATSMEEIASAAHVSKPIVYEHFGGKEGLYAVVVDRELLTLSGMITDSLESGGARARIQAAAIALLTYVEHHTDGFRILVRESSLASTGTYSTLLNDATTNVAHILGEEFERRGYDESVAEVYAQALVGMVSVTAQWWLDNREISKEVVAAHIVNLCWNGLSHLDPSPKLGEV